MWFTSGCYHKGWKPSLVSLCVLHVRYLSICLQLSVRLRSPWKTRMCVPRQMRVFTLVSSTVHISQKVNLKQHLSVKRKGGTFAKTRCTPSTTNWPKRKVRSARGQWRKSPRRALQSCQLNLLLKSEEEGKKTIVKGQICGRESTNKDERSSKGKADQSS